jgi:hypothetical protein
MQNYNANLLPSRFFCIKMKRTQGRGGQNMEKRKYSKSASKDVESAMKRKNKGTLKSGPGGKGGKVKSRKQAIAIGLSEARSKGKKVPEKHAS